MQQQGQFDQNWMVTLTEEQRTALLAFLSGQHVFVLLSAGFWREFTLNPATHGQQHVANVAPRTDRKAQTVAS